MPQNDLSVGWHGKIVIVEGGVIGGDFTSAYSISEMDTRIL